MKIKITKTEKEKLLKKAGEHIFSTGIGDSTSDIARENMKYGLAKFHLVQKQFGLEPNATFITTPDETITRNIGRWNQGISYGGKVCWGNGKEKFTFLDVKPNCCGMLVAKIGKPPKIDDMISNLHNYEKKDQYINHIKVKWDFFKSNHFIDVFKTEGSKKFGEHIAIMHAGAGEVKGDNELGFGLYFDEGGKIEKMYKKIETPFGPCYILEGQNAKDYFKQYKKFKVFASKRRELAFKKLFKGKIITNNNHQGMLNMNEIQLGCQQPTYSGEVLPISIRADTPSFLVKPLKSFSDKTIQELGFEYRANKYGVMKRLKNFNCIPHGGGYKLPEILNVKSVHETKNHKRYFELENLDGLGRQVVSDVKDLPYVYRNRGVAERAVDLGLCKKLVTLMPIYTMKF